MAKLDGQGDLKIDKNGPMKSTTLAPNSVEHVRRIFSVDDDLSEIARQLSTNSYGGVTEPVTSVKQYPGGTHSDGNRNGNYANSENEATEYNNDMEGDGNLEANQLDDRNSVNSLDSFTLRERQDAINTTHPFGIRIWKPALYKKKRSVEKAADEDIHETKQRHLRWYVHLSNIIWSLTFGLLLFAISVGFSIFILVVGLFMKSARDYSKLFLNLAFYLLWPFGKVVYLIQDDRYLHEDNYEGISVQQFYSWILSYGKLFKPQTNQRVFFSDNVAQHDITHSNEDDNINTNSNTNRNSTESYESLHDINTLNHTSYGSIQQYISNQRKSQDPNNATLMDGELNDNNAMSNNAHRRLFGRGKWTIGRILFYACFHLFFQPLVFLITLLTWLFVFTIPISNTLWKLMYHCRKHPLALGFRDIKSTVTCRTPVNHEHENESIVLCTFRCAAWHYYKYTVDGTNVVMVNLISIVFLTIFDFYVVKKAWNMNYWYSDESAIFVFCLLSIIPLAFYIGQAVASISAQTSMGLGAAINAFFSTVVEIFLYCVALQQNKGLLVEGSMIGSILGAVLLLPGLSMCGGALKRKTQRYNPASAGVSSALLIFSMIVMFVPTIFYEIYGGYIIKCDENNLVSKSIANITKAITSENCYFSRPPLKLNKMFRRVIQPLSVTCAVVLFFAYIIGLWFTLRTHAQLIWQLPITENVRDVSISHTPELVGSTETNNHPISKTVTEIDNEEAGGHEAPNWSRSKSTWILLIATLLYAVIAEILVDCVDSIIEDFPSVSPKFLGLTIFALVPNTTEFLNAISFAIHGNVALSMEIGSAYALQVCLLQIPALVIYSLFKSLNFDHSTTDIRNQMFSLIFPKWDLIGSMASVFLFTYLYAEGKSNYFKGSMLILLYVIVILGFHIQSVIDKEEFF